MPFAQQDIDSFLASYERNTSNTNSVEVVSQFADTFLAAGPSGSVIVPAAEFAQQLPARKRLFESAGLTSTKLAGHRETTVGERYVLADTKWQMTFLSNGKPPATFTVGTSFLVDMGGAAPKILLYLAHQDIFRILREEGLLPNQ